MKIKKRLMKTIASDEAALSLSIFALLAMTSYMLWRLWVIW